MSEQRRPQPSVDRKFTSENTHTEQNIPVIADLEYLSTVYQLMSQSNNTLRQFRDELSDSQPMTAIFQAAHDNARVRKAENAFYQGVESRTQEAYTLAQDPRFKILRNQLIADQLGENPQDKPGRRVNPTAETAKLPLVLPAVLELSPNYVSHIARTINLVTGVPAGDVSIDQEYIELKAAQAFRDRYHEQFGRYLRYGLVLTFRESERVHGLPVCVPQIKRDVAFRLIEKEINDKASIEHQSNIARTRQALWDIFAAKNPEKAHLYAQTGQIQSLEKHFNPQFIPTQRSEPIDLPTSY